jgi:hypothetical protein
MSNLQETLNYLGKHIQTIQFEAQAGNKLCQMILQEFLALRRAYQLDNAIQLIEYVAEYRRQQSQAATS